MLFRPSALLGLAATALLLSAARAHNHDKAAEAVATPSLRVAAKDSDPAAVKAMTVTLPNPTNSWEDKKQGKWFSQTQVFLTNTGTKAICEVKVSVPLAKAGDAKVSSSYSVDVEKTKNGLEGSLPDYVKRLEPGQMLNLGFMVEGPSADAVKLSGDVKVTEAEFCDS